jgi:hypothetical protein
MKKSQKFAGLAQDNGFCSCICAPFAEAGEKAHQSCTPEECTK